MNKAGVVAQVVALVVMVLSYNLWTLWNCTDCNIFYKGMALAIVLQVVSFGLLIPKDRLHFSVFLISLTLALANLIDELFFDATKIQWQEYALAFLVIIVILVITYAVQRKK